MKHEWQKQWTQTANKPWTSSLGILSRRKLASSMSEADRAALAAEHKRLMDEWEQTNQVTVLAPEPDVRRYNPAGIPGNSLVTA
jgi:hypothetical protein